MVKLVRKYLGLEAKKQANKNPDSGQDKAQPTSRQIKDVVSEIMEKECAPLSDLLDKEVREKIDLASGLSLEDLYTTLSDSELLNDMILEGRESPPLGPAYVISHIADWKPMADGVCVEYNKKVIFNPRLFYLLSKKFKTMNREYKECDVSLAFHNPAHLKPYTLYQESLNIPYPIILTVDYKTLHVPPKEFPIVDSFGEALSYLSTPERDIISMERKIKDGQIFLDQFQGIDAGLITKKREGLETLKQDLFVARYDNAVASAINGALRQVKLNPIAATRKLKDGVGDYRNEEIAVFAICRENIPMDDYRQSHIVVSLHLQRKGGGRYLITCYGNPLDNVKNIHVDSDGHLAL